MYCAKWEASYRTCLAAATTRPRLNTLALSNLYGRLVVDGCCSHALLDLPRHGQKGLLDVRGVLGGSFEEGDSKAISKFLSTGIYVSVIHTRGEMQPGRHGEGGSNLCNGVLHDFLVLHIALVANQQLVYTLSSVSVNLLEPLLDVVERVHVGDVVNDADTMSATVVRRGDGTETFLASSIPLRCVSRVSLVSNRRTLTIWSFTVLPSSSMVRIFYGQLYQHVISPTPLASSTTYKVHTDGWDVAFGVGIIGEPKQQARLANTAVSDEE